MKVTNTDKGTDILSGRGSKTDAKVTERSVKDTVITNNRTDQFPDVFSWEKETGGSIRTTVHASRETMDKKINEKEKENVGKTINVRMNCCRDVQSPFMSSKQILQSSPTSHLFFVFVRKKNNGLSFMSPETLIVKRKRKVKNWNFNHDVSTTICRSFDLSRVYLHANVRELVERALKK